MREKPKWADAIIDGDDNHAFFCERVAPIERDRSGFLREATAGNPNHYRQLGTDGIGGNPDVQIKTILTVRFKWLARNGTAVLHADRREFVGAPNAFPRRDRHWIAPAEIASRRRGERKAFVDFETGAAHAINQAGIGANWVRECGRCGPKRQHSAREKGPVSAHRCVLFCKRLNGKWSALRRIQAAAIKQRGRAPARNLPCR